MTKQKATPSQETQLAWLAGILDGEGSIGRYKLKRGSGYVVGVVIVNTDESIISEVEKIYGNLKIYYHKYDRDKYNHVKSFTQRKRCYEVVIRRKEEARMVLELVYPYLVGVKKEKAKDVIEWVKETRIKPRICVYCGNKIVGRGKQYCSLKCWHEYAVGNKNPNHRHGKYVFSGVTTEREAPLLGEATV